MSERTFQYEPNVAQHLQHLLDTLGEHDTIQSYRAIEKKIGSHDGLNVLVEDIKAKQKEAVQYAHYDKPEAEKEALRQADEMQMLFDAHPLVIAYREHLIEANDLLQHVTSVLQEEVNEGIEKALTKEEEKE